MSGKVAKKEHAQIVVGAEVDRVAAARPLRDGDHGAQGRATARSSTKSSSTSAGWRTSSRGSTASSAPTRSRSRPSPRSPSSTSARTSSSCSRSCRRRRTSSAAKLRAQFHPLRFQRWAFSDLNPVARVARPGGGRRSSAQRAGRRRRQRAAQGREGGVRRAISASLDYYRAMRDATSEAAFFPTYGNVFSLYIADKHDGAESRRRAHRRAARAAVREGGARVDRRRRLSGSARARRVPARAQGRAAARCRGLQMKQELIADYADAAARTCRPTSGAASAASRRSSCATSRSEALATLPKLLRDRCRPRRASSRSCARSSPTSACSARSRRREQLAMIEHIGETLAVSTQRGVAQGGRSKATATARKRAANRRR